MVDFKNKNVNPKNRKTGDCVVRALSIATGNDYVSVYQELFDISLKTGYILNEKRVEDKLLERYGFIKHKQPRKYDGTKYTIGEIDKLVDCDNNVVVIRCAHHLTVVQSGKIIDTWDCRNKCISNYYTLKVKEV